MQAGTKPASLAQKFGTELKKLAFVRRDNDQVQFNILRKVFTLNRPKSNTFTAGGIHLPNGDYAVIVLEAVREPADLKDDADTEASVVQQSQNYGAKELEATYNAMEFAADIRIMRENF